MMDFCEEVKSAELDCEIGLRAVEAITLGTKGRVVVVKLALVHVVEIDGAGLNGD